MYDTWFDRSSPAVRYCGRRNLNPFVENAELKCSLPSRSIHLHFSKTSPEFFPVLAVANTGSCVGLQNKIGHPAFRYTQLMQVPVFSACEIFKQAPKHMLLLCCFFLGRHFKIVTIALTSPESDWYVLWNMKCDLLWLFLCEIFDRVVVRGIESCGFMTCKLNK